MPKTSQQCSSSMYGVTMASHQQLFRTEDPSSLRNFGRICANSLVSNGSSRRHSTRKRMDKRRERTLSWSNIFDATLTMSKMIGPTGWQLQNSLPTTKPPSPLVFLRFLQHTARILGCSRTWKLKPHGQ